MSSKIFVNFVIPTIEAIRLECRNGINYAEKEIFCVSKLFFFFYIMNRNANTKTVSLREISKEEYLARKTEILGVRPDKTCREWTCGDNAYALKTFRNGTWKRSLPSDQCIFITSDNPLKDLCDAVVAQETSLRDEEETQSSQMKREYAQKCNMMSRRLGINFVNVLRLGLDQNKLLRFKESYNQALSNIRFMPLPKLRKLYELLRTGRVNRQKALAELNIVYFEADVNIMDFSELIEKIQKALQHYVEESLKYAIDIGSEMPYEQRLNIYKKLCHSSREVKRDALTELKVDIDSIEFKRYPMSILRQKLAATLGIDLESN